jgi:hypothetical protein
MVAVWNHDLERLARNMCYVMIYNADRMSSALLGDKDPRENHQRTHHLKKKDILVAVSLWVYLSKSRMPIYPIIFSKYLLSDLSASEALNKGAMPLEYRSVSQHFEPQINICDGKVLPKQSPRMKH